MKKILITGVKGQIGSALLPKLAEKYGIKNIIATDIGSRMKIGDEYNYQELDICDYKKVEEILKEEKITNVVNLASILSALAEKYPDLAKKVNIDSTVNLFEMARKYQFEIFFPSTIAIYGDDAPKNKVDEFVKPSPSSLYGCSKVFMENLGYYYHIKYGVDFRSVRYIGVISPFEYAYNGSTDYASEIFYKAKRNEHYKICLSAERRLPMAYIDDIIDGTLQFISAPRINLTQSTYLLNSCDFSVNEMVDKVKEVYPKFSFEYQPDLRDQIAKTWPYNYNDCRAILDWGWSPKYNSLDKIVKKMIEEVKI